MTNQEDPSGRDAPVTGESSRRYFRLYLLDQRNRVLHARDVPTDSKRDALAQGHAELGIHQLAMSFELWQNARRICKEHRKLRS